MKKGAACLVANLKTVGSAPAGTTITMTSTIRLRARQRDLLNRHRAYLQLDDQAMVQLDREVLEVLAESVTNGALIFPEFQHVANQAVARAVDNDRLPARAVKNRPATRVSEDPRRVALVRSYMEEVRRNKLRKKRKDPAATSVEKIAETVIGRGGMSVRNLQRLVTDAREEARTPPADTASVQPEEIAAELGLARKLLPAPGTPWMLVVEDHRPVNKPSAATGDDIPLRPWPPYSEDN